MYAQLLHFKKVNYAQHGSRSTMLIAVFQYCDMGEDWILKTFKCVCTLHIAYAHCTPQKPIKHVSSDSSILVFQYCDMGEDWILKTPIIHTPEVDQLY